MGTNVILAVGALVIFGTFLSSSNRLMTVNTQIAEQNEYYITAISLGQSVIAEAKAKAFDQKTIGKMFPFASPDSLSVVLGQDGLAEQPPNVPIPDVVSTAAPYTPSNPGYFSTYKYNDVDDYNGYKRKVNTPRAEGYMVWSTVQYASPTHPDSTKSVRTFCKRMNVYVASPFIKDTVKLSYAFTY